MTVIGKGERAASEAELPALTERIVQHLIFRTFMQRSSHMMAIPNTMLYGWEADMLTVTKSRFVHEYEIKTSRADFLSEKRKIEAERGTRRDAFVKQLRHRSLSGCEHGYHHRNRPNVFWYVVAEGVCDESEVPDYAGLIQVRPAKFMRMYDPPSFWFSLQKVKQAPRLHRDKIGEDKILQLAGHCCYRFWDHAFAKTEQS